MGGLGLTPTPGPLLLLMPLAEGADTGVVDGLALELLLSICRAWIPARYATASSAGKLLMRAPLSVNRGGKWMPTCRGGGTAEFETAPLVEVLVELLLLLLLGPAAGAAGGGDGELLLLPSEMTAIV